VTYNAKGFLDKNRDTFFDDLKALCFTSKLSVLVDVFEVLFKPELEASCVRACVSACVSACVVAPFVPVSLCVQYIDIMIRSHALTKHNKKE
jgi:hypothetical protein